MPAWLESALGRLGLRALLAALGLIRIPAFEKLLRDAVLGWRRELGSRYQEQPYWHEVFFAALASDLGRPGTGDDGPLTRLRTEEEWSQVLMARWREVRRTGASAEFFRLDEAEAEKALRELATRLHRVSSRNPDLALPELLDRSRPRATVPVERIEAMRRRSDLAARDVGTKFLRASDAVELYVPRKAEAEVLLRIEGSTRESRALIVVVGEAGHGKTSLLWSLSRAPRGPSVARKPETWFVKAGALREDRANRDLLLAAAEDVRAAGERLVVVVDTIDVLLHREQDRDELLLLLAGLADRGATVVAACRPQEVASLPEGTPGFSTVRLGRYDAEELPAAVDRHVAWFCGALPEYERAAQLAAIRDAAALGKPLREVCESPLTLWMLFELYAPNPVPVEVDVFGLYQDFWARRVERDLRAGVGHPTDDRDLAETVQTLALGMLIEGSPDLSLGGAHGWIARLGGDKDDLRRLRARGVVAASGDGGVRFFHQTFFEHAAARALCGRLGGRAIKELVSRTKEQAPDLFVQPVLEQALLLDLASDGPARAGAGAVLVSLLDGDLVELQQSALYVHAQAEGPTAAVHEAACRLLERASSAALFRYLEVAGAARDARTAEVMRELSVVWRRGDARLRAAVIQTLTRLAGRDPPACLKFLEEHQAVAALRGERRRPQGPDALVRLLGALAPVDPGLCWRHLVSLFRARASLSREYLALVADVVAERAEVFGADRVATRFCDEVDWLHSIERKDGERIARAFGRLWAIEWHARGASVDEMLEGLGDLPTMALRIKLNGLAEVLNDSPVGMLAPVAERLSADVATRHWASLIVWTRMLAGDGPRRPEGPTGDSEAALAVRTAVRARLAELLRVPGPASDLRLEMTPSSLVAVVLGAELAPSDLRDLLGFPVLQEVRPWFEPPFSDLLGAAFMSDHAGACVAVARLACDESAPVHAKDRLLVAMAPRALERAAWFEPFVRVAALADDATALCRTLDPIEGAEHVPPWVRAAAPLLGMARRRMAGSPAGQVRRTAAQLWYRTVCLGLSEPPGLSELMEVVARETDPNARQWLTLLLGRAVSSPEEASRAIGEITPLAASGDLGARDRALQALVEAARELHPESDQVEAVAKVILDSQEPPSRADSRQLSLIGYLADHVRPQNPARAGRLLETLLRSSAVASLGDAGRNRLAHLLVRPTTYLFRASQAERARFLRMATELDRYIARLIVDSACNVSPEGADPELDRLYAAPGVHEDVRRQILQNKRFRRRLSGGAIWPELLETLTSQG